MARTGVWALPQPSRPSRPGPPGRPSRPSRSSRTSGPLRAGVTWRAKAAVTADVLLLGALILAGLAVRLWVLGINDELNADEAIPGLMARHILYAGERPVFFYGQHYFGAAEAYLVAGLFAVFGFYPRLVTVPAVTASLLLIPVTYALGRLLAGRTAGLLAALPVAFAPPILAKLYANSGGGFSLAFLLHGLTLLAYLGAYLRPPGAPGLLPRAMLFSLLGGVLAWVWQPALALLPVLLLLLFWRQPSLRHPLRLLLALAPLAVGLAPPVAYNLAEDWPTVTQLARKYSSPLGWEAAPGIGRGAGAVGSLLLIAFGGGNEAEGGANPLQGALVAVAFPLTLVLLWRGHDVVARRRLATGLLLALTAIVAAVAAHGTVRHLVPVAHIGFVFAGAALVLLARRLLPRPAGLAEVFATVLAGGLLVLPNLYLDASAGWIFQRFVARESEVHALVDALQERGLTAGYGDYWTAYPATYLSGETVAVAPRAASIWGERVDRYPPLTYRVEEVEDPRRAFLLLDDRCSPLPYLLPLEQAEATYRLERIARWYLIWDVQPVEENAYRTLWEWYQVITFRSHC